MRSPAAQVTKLSAAIVLTGSLIGCTVNPPAGPVTAPAPSASSTPAPTVTASTPPRPVPSPPVFTAGDRATVVRVVDGDTLIVSRWEGAGETPVRVLGIDTPEVHGGRECYGPEASTRTKELLPTGTVVALVPDATQDKVDRYGRLLYYVDTGGGGDLGAALVSEGYAEPYKLSRGPAPSRYPSYVGLAAEAKAMGRGLWAACPQPTR